MNSEEHIRRRRTDEKTRLSIPVHPPIYTGVSQVAGLMGITLSRAAEYMLVDGLEAFCNREGFQMDLSFPTRARLRLRPPDWLAGEWEGGSPGDAQMRVDEDGIAISLDDTFKIKYSASDQRSMQIVTPIHVNRTQVSTDSVEGQTYRLEAVSGKRYEATLQQNGSVLVVVDDFEMNFPASGRRRSSVPMAVIIIQGQGYSFQPGVRKWVGPRQYDQEVAFVYCDRGKAKAGSKDLQHFIDGQGHQYTADELMARQQDPPDGLRIELERVG